MTYKVYVEGNYLIVDYQQSDYLVESPTKNVQIEQLDSDKEIYEIRVKGKSVLNSHISFIQDRDGNSYTSETFKTFRLNV